MKLKRGPAIFLGYTWLGFINYFILQWFFIRLVVFVQMEDINTINFLQIMFPVVPLSGYDGGKYKYWPTKRYYLWPKASFEKTNKSSTP